MQPRLHRRVVETLFALGGLWIGLALLAPCLAGTRSFPPADILLRSLPGADPETIREATRFRMNPQLYDPAIHVVPCALLVRQAWRAGDVPFRNAAFRFGTPLLGDGQSAAFSPFMLPVWIMPWPQAFAWSALLRLTVLWAGAWMYGRIVGLRRSSAAFLCVGILFLPAVAGFLQHPNANALVLLPMQFAAFEGIARAARASRRWAWTALLALATATQLLGGHYQPSLCMGIALAIYAIVRVPLRPAGPLARTGALLVLSQILGALIAAPAILPFAEALRGSYTMQLRGEWLPGLSHLRANALRHFIDPFALGDCLVPAALPWKGADRWPEQQQYVGMLPLALLPFGIATVARRGERARVAAAWIAVGVFGGCMAFGVWPLHDMVARLPVFRVNRTERFGLLLQLAAVVLASLGLDAWANPRKASAALRSRFVGAIVAMCIGALALVGLWASAFDQWSARPYMVGGAALLAIGAFRTAPREWMKWVLPAPALVLALDVAPVWTRYFPCPPARWFHEAMRVPPAFAAIPAEPERRLASADPLPPNVLSLRGAGELRAYDFPMAMRHAAFMQHVLESDPGPVEIVRLDALQSDRMARILSRCGVAAAIVPEWTDFLLSGDVYGDCESLDAGHCLVQFAQPAPFASWLPDDAVAHVEDFDEALLAARDGLAADVERVVVEFPRADAENARPLPAVPARAQAMDSGNAYAVALPPEARGRGGWLVVRISWDEAWRASGGDGRACVFAPAQIKFLAVKTEGDEETVLLQYRPRTFTAALWLCALGGIGMLATAAISLRHARRERSATTIALRQSPGGESVADSMS